MLRLVTLNTWKCDGNLSARLPLMADGLASLDPDVVCLQECFASYPGSAYPDASAAQRSSPGVARVADSDVMDTALHLSRGLRMQLFHAPARWKVRTIGQTSVPSTSGLAVLVRSGALDMDVLELPSDSRDGQRIAQGVVLRSDCVSLRVVNLHLSHLRDGAVLRESQLRAVLGHFACDGMPTILAGDFNATFHAPELSPARARDDLDVGPEAPERWRATMLGVESRARAIDHVLLLRGTRPDGPRLVDRRRVLDRPDDSGIYPSDHAGVMAEIEFD